MSGHLHYPVAMRRALLAAAISVGMTGCYRMAEVGYATSAPFALARHQPVHWGEVEALGHAGFGDFRDTAHFTLEGEAGIAAAAPGVARLGIGPTTLLMLQSGWDHDWTPGLRLRLPLQVQAGSDGAHGLISPAAELGAYFYPDQATRERSTIGVAITIGAHVFFDSSPTVPVLGICVSYGAGNSIGPTS